MLAQKLNDQFKHEANYRQAAEDEVYGPRGSARYILRKQLIGFFGNLEEVFPSLFAALLRGGRISADFILGPTARQRTEENRFAAAAALTVRPALKLPGVPRRLDHYVQQLYFTNRPFWVQQVEAMNAAAQSHFLERLPKLVQTSWKQSSQQRQDLFESAIFLAQHQREKPLYEQIFVILKKELQPHSYSAGVPRRYEKTKLSRTSAFLAKLLNAVWLESEAMPNDRENFRRNDGAVVDYRMWEETGCNHDHGMRQAVVIGAISGLLLGGLTADFSSLSNNKSLLTQTAHPLQSLMKDIVTVPLANLLGDSVMGHVDSLAHSLSPVLLKSIRGLHGSHIVNDTLRDVVNFTTENATVLDTLQNSFILVGDVIISHGALALLARGAMTRAKYRELGDVPDSNKPLENSITPQQMLRSMLPLLTLTILPSIVLIAPRVISNSMALTGMKPNAPADVIVRLPKALQPQVPSILKACQSLQVSCDLNPVQIAILSQALSLQKVDWKPVKQLLLETNLPPHAQLRLASQVLASQAGMPKQDATIIEQRLRQTHDASEQAIAADKSLALWNFLSLGVIGAGLCAAHAKKEQWKDAVFHRTMALELEATKASLQNRMLGGSCFAAQITGIKADNSNAPASAPSVVQAQLSAAAQRLNVISASLVAAAKKIPLRRLWVLAATGVAGVSMAAGITASGVLNGANLGNGQAPSAAGASSMTQAQAKKLYQLYRSVDGQKLQALQAIGGSAAAEAGYKPSQPDQYIQASKALTGLPAENLQQAKTNVAAVTSRFYQIYSEVSGTNVTAFFNTHSVISQNNAFPMTSVALCDLRRKIDDQEPKTRSSFQRARPSSLCAV
jgi:hypothetical protein